MTDADRCRIIAEFEFPGIVLRTSPNPYSPPIKQREQVIPDYPHDLNATMRAARKLLPKYRFDVSQNGTAQVVDWAAEDSEGMEVIVIHKHVEADPARAAFLALSEYLENAKRRG